jgi:hypothetical protein
MPRHRPRSPNQPRHSEQLGGLCGNDFARDRRRCPCRGTHRLSLRRDVRATNRTAYNSRALGRRGFARAEDVRCGTRPVYDGSCRRYPIDPNDNESVTQKSANTEGDMCHENSIQVILSLDYRASCRSWCCLRTTEIRSRQRPSYMHGGRNTGFQKACPALLVCEAAIRRG